MPVKKKTTTTPKAKVKNSTTSSGKNTTRKVKKPSSTLAKKPTAKKSVTKKPTLKRKKLPIEELHPFSAFPYRLEYKDGTDTRICHFECEEHRNKHINRYQLKKGSYFIDNFT